MHDKHSLTQNTGRFFLRLTLLPLCVILLSSAAGIALHESNPYLLKMEAMQKNDQGMVLSETDPEDLYPVSRGPVKDTITVSQKIPEGTYRTSRIVLRGEEADCRYLPGEIIDLPKAGNLMPAGLCPLSLHARILSVRRGTGECTLICLPSQKISLTVLLPENTLNRISASTKIHAGLFQKDLEAVVEELGSRVVNGYYPVKLSIYDRESIGRDGCTLTVSFTVEEKPDVLKLPADCIFHDDAGDAFVLLYTPEDILSMPVETGIIDRNMVEICSGLKEGDLVLPEGSIF